MTWLTNKKNPDEKLICDCFVLWRKNPEEGFSLMFSQPFTEWGCRMAQSGFKSMNPSGDAIIVKIVA